ncbi:hypothetical protein K438DRAFT_373601 [Mycena galopus ATCC 62051]|nr:hypothetical protein K438DRAFT_373601 [Mycena galopus ATCC 62051]
MPVWRYSSCSLFPLSRRILYVSRHWEDPDTHFVVASPQSPAGASPFGTLHNCIALLLWLSLSASSTYPLYVSRQGRSRHTLRRSSNVTQGRSMPRVEHCSTASASLQLGFKFRTSQGVLVSTRKSSKPASFRYSRHRPQTLLAPMRTQGSSTRSPSVSSCMHVHTYPGFDSARIFSASFSLPPTQQRSQLYGFGPILSPLRPVQSTAAVNVKDAAYESD